MVLQRLVENENIKQNEDNCGQKEMKMGESENTGVRQMIMYAEEFKQ